MKATEFKRHRIPEKCHPLIKWLFMKMNERKCSIQALAEKSGVHYTAISQWRYRSKPTLENIEACLNALGFETAAPRRMTKKRKGGVMATANNQKLSEVIDGAE